MARRRKLEEIIAKRMKDFEDNLEGKWSVKSADQSANLEQVPSDYVVSLENEDKEFVDEFKRVISRRRQYAICKG